MGRTACTEPQCLYKGALYLYLMYFSCFQTSFMIINAALETMQHLHIEFIPNTETPEAEIVSPLKNDGQQRRLTDSVPNIIAVQM